MAGRKPTTDGRGGRKSEIVTIRLDPRLKYLAELAARRQRRPLSSYVEWAIEASLQHVEPRYDSSSQDERTFADVASALWDVDDADRFAKLALHYPELLTHEEQILWKLIRECAFLWRVRRKCQGRNEWTLEESNLKKESLREFWPTFLGVASGKLPASQLPEVKEDINIPIIDQDDEIPF